MRDCDGCECAPITDLCGAQRTAPRNRFSLPPLRGFAALARASGRLTSGTPSLTPLVLLKIICSGIWPAPSNQDLRYALYSEQSWKEKGGYSDEGYGLEDVDSGAEGAAAHTEGRLSRLLLQCLQLVSLPLYSVF